MSDFVTFSDVEAMSSYGLTLLCRVDGKTVWVPYATMVRGEGTVRGPAECGRLTVPLWLALKLGLVQRAA